MGDTITLSTSTDVPAGYKEVSHVFCGLPAGIADMKTAGALKITTPRLAFSFEPETSVAPASGFAAASRSVAHEIGGQDGARVRL